MNWPWTVFQKRLADIAFFINGWQVWFGSLLASDILPAAICYVGLLFFNWLVASNQPAWIVQAKSRPLLDAVGMKIQSILPDDPENSILKRLRPGDDEGTETPADGQTNG